jgi:YegS/Rv2252/BmrU family lipid kinase
VVKTLVILNPIAGVGRAEKAWAQIESALRNGGLEFDLVRSEAPCHAITLAEKAKRDGYDTLIGVGGDGIVHEIMNGMMRASNGQPTGTFGIIPVGSGNDFAKMIPLAPRDWQTAVQKILAGNTRWFDVGKVTVDADADCSDPHMRYFDNSFDVGFGAQVSRYSHIPILTGTAMYLVAILRTMVNYFIPRLKITLADGTLIEKKSTMTVATIGRCFGGGFWIAPEAIVDDGLLDVLVAVELGRVGILQLIPKIMQGKHIGDPRVAFYRSPNLVIESPDPLAIECDGEVPWTDAHRIQIEVLPKRLQVFC